MVNTRIVNTRKLQKARSELWKESHARERVREGWKKQREGSSAVENDATDWRRGRLSSPKCGPGRQRGREWQPPMEVEMHGPGLNNVPRPCLRSCRTWTLSMKPHGQGPIVCLFEDSSNRASQLCSCEPCPALPCLPAPTLGGGLTVSSHLCKVGSDFGRNCAESPWAQLCRRSGHMDWVASLQIFGITMMLDASLEHHFTSLRQIRLVGCGWKIDLGWVWRLEMVLNQPVSALTKNLFVRYRKLLWLEIGRGFQRTKLCLVWNLSAKAMRVQSFMSR